MRTGKQSIYDEDLGENQTWFFYTDGSNKGRGYHGIRDNSVYRQGLRLSADRDLKYAPVELDGISYLVNASGAIQSCLLYTSCAAGVGETDIKSIIPVIHLLIINLTYIIPSGCHITKFHRFPVSVLNLEFRPGLGCLSNHPAIQLYGIFPD